MTQANAFGSRSDERASQCVPGDASRPAAAPGAKTYSGEGLVGLSWAFLRAGAHNVVAGLWDVTDLSTANLMAISTANSPKMSRPPTRCETPSSTHPFRRSVPQAVLLGTVPVLRRRREFMTGRLASIHRTGAFQPRAALSIAF